MTGVFNSLVWSDPATEMQANGGFSLSTRLARFVGVPGLMRDVLQIADIIGEEQIKDSLTIKRPNIKGGERKIMAVPRSDELRDYQGELSKRIDALADKKGPPQKGEDNILVIIGDGKKSSIDLRLVGREQKTLSKLDEMIGNVHKIWQETREYEYQNRGKTEPLKGATQIIFTELRKAAGFDIYVYIQTALAAKGIPADKVAFIQDYNTSKKKRKLFRQMNTGEILILIAGSKNGGTGINVQQRLIALHHLDISYVPGDIVQREGRIYRQGNKNEEIMLLAYATTGTIDAFLWQLNEKKQRMINQIMSGDLNIHNVADINENVNQMAQAKALASGNPLLLEQAGIAAEVAKLKNLKAAHINQQFENRGIIKWLNDDIEKAKNSLLEYDCYAKQYQANGKHGFSMRINGQTYTERKAAGEYLCTILENNVTNGTIGTLCGFELKVFWKTPRNIIGFHNGSYCREIGDDTLEKTYIFAKEANSFHGMIIRLENIAEKLANATQSIQEKMYRLQQKLKPMEENGVIEFPYEDDLLEKQARLKEIDDILASTDSEEKIAA